MYTLKLDETAKKRLLATTGQPCPLGCVYCFAAEPDYKPPLSFTESQTFEILRDSADEYEIVQPACDTELFLSADQAFNILEQLVALRKDISFATKMIFGPRVRRRLVDIAQRLAAQGNILAITISLTCLDDQAQELEPFAPLPSRRIANLEALAAEGIACVVGFRPLLPVVNDETFYRLVDMTKDHCVGYLSGPYYFKKMHPLLALGEELEHGHIPWLEDGGLWYKTSSPRKEQRLAEYVTTVAGKPFFGGSVEAARFIKHAARMA